MSIDKDEKVKFLSNNAGGVLGGISSGQDLICRIAVKAYFINIKISKNCYN